MKKIRSVGSLSYMMICSSEAKQQSKKEDRVVIHRHRRKRRWRSERTTIKRMGWGKKKGAEKTVHVSFPENRSRTPTPRSHAQTNKRNDRVRKAQEVVRVGYARGIRAIMIYDCMCVSRRSGGLDEEAITSAILEQSSPRFH